MKMYKKRQATERHGNVMLKIEHIQKNYGNFKLNCTMEVHAGQITGLIGQNGAGKSTTFKAALNLIRLDSGSIFFQGRNIRDMTAADKSQIGTALSDAGFSNWFQIKDIVSILAQMYPDFDRQAFMEACKKFDLPVNKRLQDFSRGMKAKLKILTALSHDSRLLILDEPTAGLDVIVRDELLTLLREYMEKDEKRCILISSHISSDLEGLCDDIYMIHHGEIILHEDTDVLLGDYGLIKASPEQYAALDKGYLLRTLEDSYGYRCLTNHRQFYQDNYPHLAVERGSIDETILMMTKGKEGMD